MRNSQRGYSLIELSIVLAILAVIIAGSITGVQAILRSNNINKTIAETNTAVGKIIARMVREPDYSNVTTANMAAAGMEIWPDSAIVIGAAARTVQHAFGGQVHVAPLAAAAQGIAKEQGFIYTLSGVPVAACNDLAMGLESIGVAMGVKNEAAVAAQTGLLGTTVKAPGTRITAAAVNGACNPATNAGTTTNITLLIPRS